MGVQSLRGSCQCGAVTFEANADPDNLIACNCSRCGRIGAILTFTPQSEFRLLSGEDSLTGYRFNKHRIEHLFCKTCGVQPFARAEAPDGTPMAAINIRCVEGVDVHALKPKQVDGKSF